VCVIIAIVFFLALYYKLKFLKRKEEIAYNPPPSNEIFELVSRVKYPQQPEMHTEQEAKPYTVFSVKDPDLETNPSPDNLIKNRRDITASLQALARKYSLSEITLATDDGLVFASSAGRDVEADAAKFSQFRGRESPPDDPDVTLFGLNHKGSHLIGIIRTENEIPRDRKKEIGEDTKGILQWWL
jgi:hypothetical protein